LLAERFIFVARQDGLQASGTAGDANNAGIRINLVVGTIPIDTVI
jgi:hypothetical protein